MTRSAVFVSPHLDDAVLSCGGGIARLVRAGVRVTVVTVFTADVPAGEPLSANARRQHASWGVGDAPFAARRDEDAAALAVLGAKGEYLGFVDAIYRRGADGLPLYARVLTQVAEEDREQLLPRLLEALAAGAVGSEPETRVFCPVGIAGHPDHTLVRLAVEQLVGPARIVTYDDYPYESRAENRAATAERPGVTPLALTAAELDARIDASACYASQLRGLFPSGAERFAEILSARLPLIGRAFVRPADAAASRERMAAQMRADVSRSGGEPYRWPAEVESPFPPA